MDDSVIVPPALNTNMNSRSLISASGPVWNCSFSFHVPAKLGSRSVLFELSDGCRQLLNNRVARSIREHNVNILFEFEMFTMTIPGHTLLRCAERQSRPDLAESKDEGGTRFLSSFILIVAYSRSGPVGLLGAFIRSRGDHCFEGRSTRQAQTDNPAEARVIRMYTGSVTRCRFSKAILRRCATVSKPKTAPDVMI